MAHESLLADMLVSKYADHFPLYRQAKILSREGVTIASSTMSDWVSSCCKLLAPLYEALKQEVLRTEYLQVDESPIKVLDKAKKGRTHRGYYWLYHDVDGGLVYFDYQKGRARDGPASMLKGYQGYLQTDGYGVYDKFENVEGITLLGCMAHNRRYFEKAKENDPERANYFLSQVQSLYLLEREMKEKELDWNQKAALRQSMAMPVLENLQQWLTSQKEKVLPKSAIGKAIAYSLGQWKRIMRYTLSGGLMIDNNLIENQIRPVALGRKNYLFAGSHRGARNSAIIYSRIGSYVRNNIDPFQYLYAILTKPPDYPVNKISDLLPCNISFEKPDH
ncbi:MAG: IS66 family transposase [Cytophagales bacterium]|nr:IS66 family transposase [Cytophagales bacterium]